MRKLTLLNFAEIIVLLGLPMLSSQLNVLYIVFAIIIIIVSRYMRKEKWPDYGFKPAGIKLMLLAATIGIVFALIDNYLLEPLVNKLTGKPTDLSSFENIKGHLSRLLTMLAIGWVIGGFFEEFFFRGYLLNRINLSFNNKAIGKWLGIILTSVAFAVAHSYQDITGMINTFYFAILLGFLYYFFNKNVWYLILVHGFYDTVGILFLYFSK
jgi:membrane protease YdiL (CAAX protease family)